MNNSRLSTKTEWHLKRYYRWNSLLYDATRWAILWGRAWFHNYLRIELKQIKKEYERLSIIEVGCGTGYHIAALAPEFRDCMFYGYDVSVHMLDKASSKVSDLKNVQLRQEFFSSNSIERSSANCFICSYSISMNEDIHHCIKAIHDTLSTTGVLYVVDFISSSSDWFNRWMILHGVYVQSEIISKLQYSFKSVEYETKRGFLGLYYYGIIKAIK
ncbi:MAG: hypothetical protein CL672_04445 [Balneola sp.]|nr:hypothetical protein [Balneola sp.]|tara:strand:+ start:6439 stop:7083 length:645 start_codon:yes stop_codon:yes gene_type:complete